MSVIKRGRPSQKEPPSQAGVYRIIDKESGEILYIGETSNLRRRKKEHLKSGKYDPEFHVFAWQLADAESTSEDRREVERKKIDRHEPSENKRRGGGGRKTSQMPLQQESMSPLQEEETKVRSGCFLVPWMLGLSLLIALTMLL